MYCSLDSPLKILYEMKVYFLIKIGRASCRERACYAV